MQTKVKLLKLKTDLDAFMPYGQEMDQPYSTAPGAQTRLSFLPFKGQKCQIVTVGHPGLTYIFNF